MAGLVGHSRVQLVAAFVDFDSSSSPEQIQAAVIKCFSELALPILQDVAFESFAEPVKKLKKDGKFKEALDLMEAVPLAAAKLYNCPPLCEDESTNPSGEAENGKDEESVTEHDDNEDDTRTEVVPEMY
ncbi:hypothetical protein IQ06DRAFT_356112 [Phaeosphaeriaceae sp. SRC1lsM3a]|nr:hypothetical protein IQ06DRAFT_356112 [Stagonospora sp. SRC1lsM3a]